MRIRMARGLWTSRFGLVALGLVLFLFLFSTGVFAFYYLRFSRLIDERLSGQVFGRTSHVYSAPQQIFVGEKLSPAKLVGYLESAGYAEGASPAATGLIKATGSTVEIYPSRNSYFDGGNASRVDFSRGEVSRLASLPNKIPEETAEIEPELLTNLFDSSREKRRVVRFEDLPPMLVRAVLSAEDKRFFEHPGFDPLRILGAAWADLRRGAKAQGASTLDMQLARSFFFSTKREWRRKIAETLVALELEQRFDKRRIFELYANEVYLGNRRSFAIRGFGEAAEAYFGKDVRDLDLAEAAFLAGIIRAPNRYSSAEDHPGRAAEARDRVLAQMVENGYITPRQAVAARKEQMHFVGGGVESASAPYFIDMVRDHLLEKFSESDLTTQSYRIYTTLDPELQQAAHEAVQIGMKDVDRLLARRYAIWRHKGKPVPVPQVALVALDARTGEIRALVGGRDYGVSQFNHALARRQPGSSFKPFVYAAAFDNAVEGLQPTITPETTVVDEPTTFTFDGQDYTPNNYGAEFYGTVTARDALVHSLNVATVKVAEMVGYQRVADVARQMGLDPSIQATPAMALGAYEMTPIEVAAGYTIFANDGIRAEPIFLDSVISSDGNVLERVKPETRSALDPRVAYLVTNILEDVINRGTGAVVRAEGFTAPAAGKTGTSRDGWFAGFSSNLVCVVWIGFDDNRDLGLSGEASAGPIWTEFMKRAEALPAYSGMQPFAPPQGVVEVSVDPETGQLATPSCPTTREEVYVAGTEPTVFCEEHGGRMITQIPPVSWLARLFGKSSTPPTPAATAQPRPAAPAQPQGTSAPQPAVSNPPKPSPTNPEAEKKKNLLERIFGIFGGSKKPSDTTPKPPQ